MRLCVDATSLLLRSAGIKSYTYQWLEALRATGHGHEATAFPFVGNLAPLRHDRSIYDPLTTYARLSLVYGVKLWGSAVLDPYLRNADLFHASNQVRSLPTRVPVTATLHDLTCWLMPELHTPANVQADKEFADRVLRRCRGLIAVSENTRQDAIRLLGLLPERVVTIHSGVPDHFFTVTGEQRQAARDQLGLTKPYVLFLGTIEPRKNLDRLLNAWVSLTGDDRCGHELVVAGPKGWSASHTEARLDSGLPAVRRLGYVPEPLLPGLVGGAAVFAYPSLYEGFGFPVAQAMAAEVAVLTSNTSCLPEVVGEGGLTVDPLSEAELAGALRTLLDSPKRRSELAATGRALAQRYRWTECARRSWALFESVR